MTTKTPKLLPCPLCGLPVYISKTAHDTETDTPQIGFLVSHVFDLKYPVDVSGEPCPMVFGMDSANGDAYGVFDSPEEAAQHWNTRP